MRTRLVYVILLTVCLATFICTDSLTDPPLEDSDALEDDFQDNPTTDDDYDDYGGLVRLTTKIFDVPKKESGAVHPVNEFITSSNLEADIEEKNITTPVFAPESTKGTKERKNSTIGVNSGCGDPPSAVHAKIGKGKKHRYSEGDVVYYSCEFGYVTDAFEWTSRCFMSEETNALEWTPPQITCIPRSCGDPGFVDDGRRVGSLFTFPNRVSFECDEGYELVGNGIRYCKTTGTWSGTLPTCERIFCDPPTNPLNGKVSFTSLEFGSELAYECSKGFVLRDYHLRVCSDNGTWSGSNPICQDAQCEPPVAPEYGSVQVVGGKSSVDSVAIYTCDAGRLLVGSATSKCLDIGQWTFPTPKCLEPCAVPKVPHGTIGKYEKDWRKRLRYKKLSEGEKIDDGSELVLSCESKYEPFGTTEPEEIIICVHGEWDRYPHCDPAKCRTPPPPTANASVRKSAFNQSHGSGVTYDCHAEFTKAKYGNVVCHFGTWQGHTPTCSDTRCDVETLAPFSIKRTAKRYYKSSEFFTPQCETGFTASRFHRLQCSKGEWKGLNPLPCTPANCSAEPPKIENGQIVSFSRLHTAEVAYKCDEFFILKNSDSKVQCKFGEWTGTKPICQDTRCYVENIKDSEWISPDTERITSSGHVLQTVQCVGGYSFSGDRPRCVNGEWERHQALCKESDCYAYNIDNGKLTEKVRKESCNIFGRNCAYWDEYPEIGRNRRFSVASSIYVTCDRGYVFHGIRNNNNVKVKCSRGQWQPSPVCLKPGTPYYEVASTPESSLIAAKNAARTSTFKPAASTTRRPAIERNPLPPTAKDTHRVVEDHNSNCSCTFLNSDANLRAYSGTERLRSGILIKDGCKVRFHCSPVGHYRLVGQRDLICNDCRTWHSSEYPQCVIPRKGDTVLRLEGVYIELPGGSIGVFPGSSLRVICTPEDLTIYPQWLSFPKSAVPVIYEYVEYEREKSIKSKVLEISNSSPEQNGIYECGAAGYRSNSITIQVLISETSCPVFSEDEYISIHYDKGQSLNSSAIFSCKRSNQKIVGPNILTCLSNGQWSGDPPQCISVCPKLQETEDMFIEYSNDQNVDSTAIFYCVLPRIRTGVTTTACKRNGEWADPMPTCYMPSCTLEDLYSVLPEYVVPNVDEIEGGIVPYDFSLSLRCDENRRLIGTSDTTKCGHEGKWKLPNVQCVIGCSPVEKHPESEILVDPEEEFYRIGQLVTFSCAPGQKLTSEVERVMCLMGGWSEKVIPTCVIIPTDEYVNDEGTTHTEESV